MSKCLETFAFVFWGGEHERARSKIILYIPRGVLYPCSSLSLLATFPFSPSSRVFQPPNLSLPLLCSGSVAPTADSHNVRRRANCSSTPDPTPLRHGTHSPPLFPTTPSHPPTSGDDAQATDTRSIGCNFLSSPSLSSSTSWRSEHASPFSRGFCHCLLESLVSLLVQPPPPPRTHFRAF